MARCLTLTGVGLLWRWWLFVLELISNSTSSLLRFNVGFILCNRTLSNKQRKRSCVLMSSLSSVSQTGPGRRLSWNVMVLDRVTDWNVLNIVCQMLNTCIGFFSMYVYTVFIYKYTYIYIYISTYKHTTWKMLYMYLTYLSFTFVDLIWRFVVRIYMLDCRILFITVFVNTVKWKNSKSEKKRSMHL